MGIFVLPAVMASRRRAEAQMYIYFVCYNSSSTSTETLWKIDAEGNLLWKQYHGTTSKYNLVGVAVSSDELWAGGKAASYSGQYHGTVPFRKDTGARIYRSSSQPIIGQTPDPATLSLRNGKLYVGGQMTWNTSLYNLQAYTTANGALLFRKLTDTYAYTRNILFDQSDNVYIVYWNRLVCLDPDDGSYIWDIAIDPSSSRNFHLLTLNDDASVCFVSQNSGSDAKVAAVDTETQQILWTAYGYIPAGIAYLNGYVYTMSNAGRIDRFNANTGARTTITTLSGIDTLPQTGGLTASPDGFLYAGGGAVLYKLDASCNIIWAYTDLYADKQVAQIALEPGLPSHGWGY